MKEYTDSLGNVWPMQITVGKLTLELLLCDFQTGDYYSPEDIGKQYCPHDDHWLTPIYKE